MPDAKGSEELFKFRVLTKRTHTSKVFLDRGARERRIFSHHTPRRYKVYVPTGHKRAHLTDSVPADHLSTI